MLFLATSHIGETMVVLAENEDAAREIVRDELLCYPKNLIRITHVGELSRYWQTAKPFTKDGEADQTCEYLLAEETAWAIREAAVPPPKYLATQLDLFA